LDFVGLVRHVCLALVLARGVALPDAAPTPAASPLDVAMDTAEADAVLTILARHDSRRAVRNADWDGLFQTAGYQRLFAREKAMKRPFSNAEFETFVLSQNKQLERASLSATLQRWKSVDVTRAGQKALVYLPPGARIRATIFPVIKPKPNSFVFDKPAPSIFLALDPNVSAEKLANTLVHELHHIGFASACPPPEVSAEAERLPPAPEQALQWLSAFGEGFAMLAAAGNVDTHPHQVSAPADRDRWDADMKNVDRDLENLDAFFREILEKRLTSEQADTRGAAFFGIQGPWYTVGYQMATTIERAFGRREMIQCFCDARRLPGAYNQAADKLHQGDARWSRTVTDAFRPDKSEK
jgi:hypothetical protein